ncbi:MULTISPECIES: SixA phosphatase family protein [Microbacterium]|uniref:2,3-bisphosphoglycerate-dependent phosphoglycerate mutase n=1 Tax=Microbacterium trichothecenolyticum TaxID=69370 RepID=A0A0M2HCZ3_MICTR|nr:MULTISPECIES: histidine phosphatase family protein [Microbacterium]KJL41983.1 2,3-bisphosphoglycerate-dependent phosphoglycerate mutase [Microbacterium trichothecenolyticum]MDR7190964.1 phosphohistidine phosphatase [Microbacterium sp. BE35]
MIRLALVRHAKSEWGNPGLDDHDRPLNDRGMRDAPRMAARLAATGFRPDVILSSTAVRARTTAEAFAAELGVAVSLDPELYGAPAHTLLAAAAATRAATVMVVAHDPGMSALAASLSDDDIDHMPTCAVATFIWVQDDWDVASSVDPDNWTFDTPPR